MADDEHLTNAFLRWPTTLYLDDPGPKSTGAGAQVDHEHALQDGFVRWYDAAVLMVPPSSRSSYITASKFRALDSNDFCLNLLKQSDPLHSKLNQTGPLFNAI